MVECPVKVGQRVEDIFQLSVETIVAGAQMLGDRNPLHHDSEVAAESRFGSLIACGPHAAGLHACMLPSFVSSLGFGVVGVEFSIQYRHPVLPEIPHTMWWTVREVESRGRNWYVTWIGAVEANRTTCITGTGEILILGP